MNTLLTIWKGKTTINLVPENEFEKDIVNKVINNKYDIHVTFDKDAVCLNSEAIVIKLEENLRTKHIN